MCYLLTYLLVSLDPWILRTCLVLFLEIFSGSPKLSPMCMFELPLQFKKLAMIDFNLTLDHLEMLLMGEISLVCLGALHSTN